MTDQSTQQILAPELGHIFAAANLPSLSVEKKHPSLMSKRDLQQTLNVDVTIGMQMEHSQCVLKYSTKCIQYMANVMEKSSLVSLLYFRIKQRKHTYDFFKSCSFM